MADEEKEAGANEAGQAGAPQPRPRRSLLDRIDHLVRRKPLRYYAFEYDFHLLPVQVSHSRRARHAIVFAVAVLVAFSAWYWVIPRMDAHLAVQYHEGLFNSIDIDAQVVNGGTVSLTSLHVELTVTVDGTGEAIGSTNVTKTLPAHATLDMDPVAFRGNQITTNYRIAVTVRYVGADGPSVQTFDYVTVEPFMNLYFDDVIA